jgi:hypothetical protein
MAIQRIEFLASLHCRLCDPDLPRKLRWDFRLCRHLQPWLSGNADVEAGGLLISFQTMCLLDGLVFAPTAEILNDEAYRDFPKRHRRQGPP